MTLPQGYSGDTFTYQSVDGRTKSFAFTSTVMLPCNSQKPTLGSQVKSSSSVNSLIPSSARRPTFRDSGGSKGWLRKSASTDDRSLLPLGEPTT